MKGRMNFKMFTQKSSEKKVAVNDNHVLYIQDGGSRTVIWLRVHGSCAPVAVEVKEDFDTVFSRLNTAQSSIVCKGRVKTDARKVVEGFAGKTEGAEAK